MNFELTDGQEMLRDTVRRYLADRAPIDRQVRPRLGASVPWSRDDVWDGLAELGLQGAWVPEAHGGGGLGVVELGLVCEELGRALYPGPFAPTAVGAVALLRDLDDETSVGLLRGIATGEQIVALAAHEIEQRYDWQAPATTARAVGTEWRLSGSKAPVAGGLAADAWLVTARDDLGFGLFCVQGREGVRSASLESVDETSRLARLELTDAPAVRLGPADATPMVARALDVATIAQVADGLGAAGRAFELAAAYAHERRQFGKPIGSFQAVQHLLVDMLQDLELTRAATYYALWAADEAEPEECHRAATRAKAFASRALPELGASAIQIFGGIGYTWEHDIHLFYKRVLTVGHLYGDESAQLDELARILLDPPRE